MSQETQSKIEHLEKCIVELQQVANAHMELFDKLLGTVEKLGEKVYMLELLEVIR